MNKALKIATDLRIAPSGSKQMSTSFFTRSKTNRFLRGRQKNMKSGRKREAVGAGSPGPGPLGSRGSPPLSNYRWIELTIGRLIY